MFPVIEWRDNKIYMIDQRILPLEEKYLEHTTYEEVAESIENMTIRGAPAIGVAAAMGIALGLLRAGNQAGRLFKQISERLAATRPTAVNLFWAIKRMERVYARYHDQPQLLIENAISEAKLIDQEDVEKNKRIGDNGQNLLKSGQRVLTHCNAGALATAGFGTALGVIRAAVKNGKKISVVSSETRPFLQGARLTVWELQRENIPVKLITDNMAGHLMGKGIIDAVIVGADRIAANGDAANKIGTYSLAVLAKHHHIPFYIAAPVSTIDAETVRGSDIPIEERSDEEVIFVGKQQIAPAGTEVFNPAFDVTPHELITAIITEYKILYPDYQQEIEFIFNHHPVKL